MKLMEASCLIHWVRRPMPRRMRSMYSKARLLGSPDRRTQRA